MAVHLTIALSNQEQYTIYSLLKTVTAQWALCLADMHQVFKYNTVKPTPPTDEQGKSKVTYVQLAFKLPACHHVPQKVTLVLCNLLHNTVPKACLQHSLTNSMQKSPCWQNESHSNISQPSNNRKVHYHIHKSPRLTPEFETHTHTYILWHTLILFCHPY